MNRYKYLTGRRKITSPYTYCDESNVVDILKHSLFHFEANRHDSEYLYNYYRGKQPVYEKRKDIRPEINNKIVVNKAFEIINFTVSYLVGEPIQYIPRDTEGNGEELSDNINILNTFMAYEDKDTKDVSLQTWSHITGTSYRMVLPDAEAADDEAPFSIYTLDPRKTWVVHSTDLGEYPIVAFREIVTVDNKKVYDAWTKNALYTIKDYGLYPNTKVTKQPHFLGGIPIIEYPLNDARLGSFEVVIDLLDVLNDTTSSRIDGIEQFVQAYMFISGANIDSDDIEKFKKNLLMILPEGSKTGIISSELKQSEVQTFADDIKHEINSIAGIPAQGSGNKSTSDNNGAVILREGWEKADSFAKYGEKMYKKADKSFLKIVTKILRDKNICDIKLSQIETAFTRRNYADLLTKVNVLTQMLSNDKIHPLQAYEHCGMFADATAAYKKGMDYYNEILVKEEKNSPKGNTEGDKTSKTDISANNGEEVAV